MKREQYAGYCSLVQKGSCLAYFAENLKMNSSKQHCINHCNKAIQQQFNRFVLHNQQEEYHGEEISWSFIKFLENQDVLELINFKCSSILNMFYDQCWIPGISSKKLFHHFMINSLPILTLKQTASSWATIDINESLCLFIEIYLIEYVQ